MLLGIPGAFLPSITFKFLPEYLQYYLELQTLGKFDQIYILTNNDPFVLTEFAEEIDGLEKFTYLSDFTGELTKGMSAEMEMPTVGPRCRPLSAIINNGDIEWLAMDDSYKFTVKTRVFGLFR